MENQHYLNNLWRWKCGLSDEPKKEQLSLESLKQSEWSVDFETLMRNRLIIGAIRYGKIKAVGKPKYDRIGSMIKRLSKYQESGNKEFLVDVANLCLLEFVECHHPNAHFTSIDDGEHVLIK